MHRFRRFAVMTLVALALLGAAAAFPPGPYFNPQPDPPGVQARIMVNEGLQA